MLDFRQLQFPKNVRMADSLKEWLFGSQFGRNRSQKMVQWAAASNRNWLQHHSLDHLTGSDRYMNGFPIGVQKNNKCP